MLFDLRSRGRRRTVQVVYLGLAVLIGGGLILFGVGTGSGTGGLLNAFTGNGSGNAQSQAISQQEKNADKQVKVNPNNAAAWAELVSARWADAATGTNYNSTTGAFSTDGKKELTGTTDAWEHYSSLTKQPNPNLAILAARAYGNLGNYSSEANTWEIVSTADPSSAHGFECLAASAYAAKQTREGDLALNKALSLTPKLGRATLKTQVQAAKTTPTIAASC
jgi:hypothetical protein